MQGFVSSYERIGSPSGLSGGGPTPGDNEYVPRISVLLDDFQQFGASAEIETCVFGLCFLGAVTGGTTINTDLFGSFNFDWWDLGGTGLGDPDYVNNDPWDFYPLFHGQDTHLFPFS